MKTTFEVGMNEKIKSLDSFFDRDVCGTIVEKDEVSRLKNIVGKVHIGMISAFKTTGEYGFAGIDEARKWFGSGISFQNDDKFLRDYVLEEGQKYSRKQNFSRSELLGNMLRSWKKVSFKSVTGGYKEKEEDAVDQERSFVVISRPDVEWEEFKNIVIGMGVLFGQHSVFLKEAGKESSLYFTNYSEVLSEEGSEIDNGKYKFKVTNASIIGTKFTGVNFKNTFSAIDNAIKDTKYAYSIFDKYGKRLDVPDAHSKVGSNTKVYTADVAEESHDQRYSVNHWVICLEEGEKFGGQIEQYSYQFANKFIDFSKLW